MNVKDAIIFGVKYLNKYNVEQSNLKSRILLSKVLEVSKEFLVINDMQNLNENQEKKYMEFLKRLSNNIPIQYITNKQEFMKLDFYVDEYVLIPQPDTEILVEEVLKICENKNNIKILDLCTGSGAIAISIAKNIRKAKIYASDINKKALEIAKKNSKNNSVKIEFINSDMFENINVYDFDIIVSNPPYIKTDVITQLDKQVQCEPILALDGGKDGMKFYKQIAENAKKYIKSNGIIVLEIGFDQKDDVCNLLKNNNYKKIECKKDLAGKDRVIIARR